MLALHLQSLFGLLVIILLAWSLSENRHVFSARKVATGVALQFGLAILLLVLPTTRSGLLALNDVVGVLQASTQAGTSLVFGYVGGAPAPFDVTKPQNMASLAFEALPLVLIMSALAALLWHWRILPLIVR